MHSQYPYPVLSINNCTNQAIRIEEEGTTYTNFIKKRKSHCHRVVSGASFLCVMNLKSSINR
jgi:hypothetical protein